MPNKQPDMETGVVPEQKARRKTDEDVPATEAAEAVKEAAAARRANKKEKQKEKARASSGFSTFEAARDGVPLDAELERIDRAESIAQAAARISRERKSAELEAARIADEDEYQYALICPACGEMGAFFVSNPLNRILYQSDWFSRMKSTAEAWPMDIIPCQECFKRTGEYNPLPILHAHNPEPRKGMAFTPYARRVVKFPKDEERFEAEGWRPAVMSNQRKISEAEMASKEA